MEKSMQLKDLERGYEVLYPNVWMFRLKTVSGKLYLESFNGAIYRTKGFRYGTKIDFYYFLELVRNPDTGEPVDFTRKLIASEQPGDIKNGTIWFTENSPNAAIDVYLNKVTKQIDDLEFKKKGLFRLHAKYTKEEK